MNKVNEILIDWTYQLESGYPKKDEDYIVLQNILQESTDFDQSTIHRILDKARGLQEQEETGPPVDKPALDNGSIDLKELDRLKSAFNQIAVPYGRYLKIFSLFDPNSLGTISEVLLSKLLDKLPNVVSTEHTGGSQSLDDIRVDGKLISLKTTEGGQTIGLGSDITNIDDKNIKGVLNYFNYIKQVAPEDFETKTIKELTADHYMPATIRIPSLRKEWDDAKKSIIDRIESIIKKMVGSENDHYFVWVEKVKAKGSGNPITAIKIHTYKYDETKLRELFYSGKPKVTNIAWGITDSSGQLLINSDSALKYLNINPYVVTSATNETGIETIPLTTDSYMNKKISPTQLVSTKFLDVLDSISNELFGN